MHLRIRGPDNQMDLDDVESTWTVKKLRETVAGKLSPAIPPERLKLILMGRVIRDEQTLEELHLEDDHVVHMVVRPDGVPPSPAPQAENPIPPQPRMGTFNVFSLDGSGNGTTTQGTIGGADLGGLLAGLFGGVVPQAGTAFSIRPATTPATAGSTNTPATGSGRASRTGSNLASPSAGPSATPATTNATADDSEGASPTGNFSQFFPAGMAMGGLPFPMAFGLPTGGASQAPAPTPNATRPLHPPFGGPHVHFGGPHGHAHHQAHINAHHAAQAQAQMRHAEQQQQAAAAAAAAAMPPSNNTNVSGVQVHLHVSLAELDQVPAALQRLNQNLSGSVDVRVVDSGSAAASAANSSANAAAAAASAGGRGSTTSSSAAPSTSTATRTTPQVSTQALSRPAPAAPTTAAASKAPQASRSSSSSSPAPRPSRPLPPGSSFAKSIADTINSKMRVPHELLELMSGQYGALIRIQPDIERTIRAELKTFVESSAGISAVGAGADPNSAHVKHAWMMAVSQDIVTKCLLEHPGHEGSAPQAPLAALFHNTQVKSSWRSDLHILSCIKRAVYSFLEKVVLGKFVNAKLPTQVSPQTVSQLQVWAKEVHEACVKTIGCFINFLGDEYFLPGPAQSIHVIQTCITTLFPLGLAKYFPQAVPFEEVLGRFLANNVGNWAEIYRQLMAHSKAADFETFRQDKPAPPRPPAATAAAASSSSAMVSPTNSVVVTPTSTEQDRILNDALKDSDTKRPTTPPGEKRPRE